MNMAVSEIDFVDLIPTITELVRCYCEASGTEQVAIRCQIHASFAPELAAVIEWAAQILSTPNRTIQVTELMACAMFGLDTAKMLPIQPLYRRK